MPGDFCQTCFTDLEPGQRCAWCASDKALEADDVLHPGYVLRQKYRVGRLLGRGGFGATYVAWDLNLQVRVAIKEFLPRQLVARSPGGTKVRPFTGSEDAFSVGLDQFLTEARNLARFRGKLGIISVLEFFPENNTGYMVMEYLAGITLEQYIASRGRIEYHLALQLLTPVADALRTCHEQGLIHRDISPDNIFISSDRHVKVLDFGAARYAVGVRSMNLSVILKEGYAPFEQYQRNGRQGPWTDIYALTATLYRLLTGELPPTAPDRLAGTALPKVTAKGVKIPAQLETLIEKGMAIQPEQRYQTIDAFFADLQGILKPGSGSSVRDPAPKVPEQKPRNRLAVIGGGIGVAVAAVVALLLLFDTSPVDHEPTPQHSLSAGTNLDEDRKPGLQAQITPLNPQRPINPPAASNPLPMESARVYVTQAAQAEIDLAFALKISQDASDLLSTLPANSRSESILRARQTQEDRRKAAISKADDASGRYLAEVTWLANQDGAVVDSALKLESEKYSAPTMDEEVGRMRAQFRGAIDQLSRHVKEERMHRLTGDEIHADAITLSRGTSR